jgi:hypothetical protein
MEKAFKNLLHGNPTLPGFRRRNAQGRCSWMKMVNTLGHVQSPNHQPSSSNIIKSTIYPGWF